MKNFSIKTFSTLALLFALAFSGTACTDIYLEDSSYDYSYSEPTITKGEARHIALNHSGVKPKRATFEYVRYEERKNGGVYKIRFYTPNKVFNYTINARNGNVKNYNVNRR